MRTTQVLCLILPLMLVTSCATTTMKNKTAILETNYGTITLELFEDKTPITTKNFMDLAEKGVYDGTKFHRVIKNFMIQGGDPLTKDDTQKELWGTGGPGYEIADEFAPGLSNVKGTIAMANHGPNTGGSQFLINLADNTYLEGKHAVFGKVIEGMDIVEKIGSLPTDGQDRPKEDVVLQKVTIK